MVLYGALVGVVFGTFLGTVCINKELQTVANS